MDDRAAALPAQPRAGPPAHHVPGPARRLHLPADRGPRPQTFRLSAPQPAAVVVPGGDGGRDPASARWRAGGLHDGRGPARCPPSRCSHVRTVDAEGPAATCAPHSAAATTCRCFTVAPQDGDALLLGLSEPAGGCAVALTLDCRSAGVGVDPDDPPLAWEAWTGEGWERVRGRARRHRGLQQAGRRRPARAGRAPARPPSAGPGRPGCGCGWSSPGPTSPVHREPGAARGGGGGAGRDGDGGARRPGRSGRCWAPARALPGSGSGCSAPPVVPGEDPLVVEVAEPRHAGRWRGGRTLWRPWEVVPDFGDAGPQDRHVLLESRTGEIVFGPARA